MTTVLDNAREAVERDPVRIVAESAERAASRSLHRAVLLAPSVEVCEALLRGEPVPVDVLDVEQLARFLPPEVDAPEGAPSSSVQPGASTLRLDDLPSVAAWSSGVERVRLARVQLDPGNDDAPRARDNIEDKAARMLAEGRVRVSYSGDGLTAVVQGDTDTYTLHREPDRWRCTCPARVTCSHRRAVELVTGGPEEVPA